MSMLDKYNKVANDQSKAMQAVTEFVREALPFLILVVNILVTVVLSLYDPTLKNPWSPEFFVRLLTNITSTMVCYSCFVHFGEKNEKLTSAAYSENLKKWGAMSGKIRQNYADKFMAYCRKQVEIEREELRHYYILNNTMISVAEYEEQFKKLTNEQIDKLVAHGALHVKEAKYIKKANSVRYLKPINPILILCGVNKMNLNDVGRDGTSSSVKAIAMRPAIMFVMSTMGAMLGASWKGIDSASAVFNIVWSVLMIVLASYTGYSAGVDAGRKEMDKIKARIFFLERFNAEEGFTEQ